MARSLLLGLSIAEDHRSRGDELPLKSIGGLLEFLTRSGRANSGAVHCAQGGKSCLAA